MYRKTTSLFVIAVLIGALFLAFAGAPAARADDWTKIADKGIDGKYSPFPQMVTSTTQDGTDYYVGTQTIPGGFQIWRYNGTTWTNIAKEGLGNRNNVGVASMCVYSGKLYAGITRAAGMWNGSSIFAFDGSHWTEVTQNAFGNVNVQSFTSMEILEGKLYVGTFNTQDGTMVFCFDGTTWTRANTDGYGGGAANKDTNWLVSDGTDLYGGVRNDADGCKLLKYEGGTTWTQLGTNGFGDADNVFTPTGYAYGTELGAYILMGTTNQVTGAQLWLYDISQATFTQVNESGFGDAASWYIGAITFYGGNFYVGVDHKDEHGGATPCQMWSFPGTDWTGWQGKWVQRLAGGVPGAPAIATAITSLDTYRDRMLMTVMCPGWPVEVFSTLDTSTWTLMASPGWLTHYNSIVWSMAPYAGDLYAGTYDPYTGCEVWRRDEGGWTAVATGGFGTPDPNWTVSNMVEYNGCLYAGTGTGMNESCGVYRYDGSTWSQVNIARFGNNKNTGIGAMAVFNGKMYVTTINGNEAWCYDGTSWAKVGSELTGSMMALAVHEGELYGGTLAGNWTGQVFRYAGGTTWTPASPAGFDIDGNVTTLTSYNGKLYAGLMGKETKKTHVYRWDGRTVGGWASVATPGFGQDKGRITSAAAFNGKLYMATDDTIAVFSYDGSSWTQANTDGFGDPTNRDESSMAVLGNSLFVGTDNFEYGAQIWQTTADVPPVPQAPFFFAEGTTRPGFETYFSIENPAKTAASVKITYMKGDGTQKEQAISVPASS
ncbi:MAG: Kelch repeat-containing protein, partial [Candidatus Geothermincolia bacterium]